MRVRRHKLDQGNLHLCLTATTSIPRVVSNQLFFKATVQTTLRRAVQRPAHRVFRFLHSVVYSYATKLAFLHLDCYILS
jgi:hypothetical protein